MEDLFYISFGIKLYKNSKKNKTQETEKVEIKETEKGEIQEKEKEKEKEEKKETGKGETQKTEKVEKKKTEKAGEQETEKTHIYYRNKTPLIKYEGTEKEREYREDEFLGEVKNEVSNIINRRFDNIVLLAGAGASVVTDANGKINDDYGKTMKKIAEIIFEKLNSTKNNKFYKFQDLVEMTNFKNKAKITKDNGKNEILVDDFNLEDFLSNIIHFQPYVNSKKSKKYERTKNKILELIREETEYSYDENIFKHETILNLLTKKIEAPNKLSVVTTNYDTLFEDAANENNYTVFDGFKFMPEPEFDSDMFNWNLVKEVPDIKTKELEYNSRVINLIKIHGSITWKRVTENKIVRTEYENIEAENSVMIFPSSDKYAQSYQEPYFALFSRFQELLKRKNTLLITTGFSFSDNHICEIVTQAIKNNRSLTVLVSDYNIKQSNNTNWGKLLKLVNEYHQISFLKATLNTDLAEFLGGNNDN